jgi:hypothetical protein
MKKAITGVLCVVVIIVSCSKNNNATFTEDCSSTAKSYSNDVSPIIQSFCAVSGCHASGSTNGPGALTGFQQVFNARQAIRAAVVNGSMPQNGSLTSSQKNAIICWIDNGATNN